MFMIKEDEYDKIVDVISNFCCDCSSAYCSETDCDVYTICEILNRHLVKNCIEKDDDKLPF